MAETSLQVLDRQTSPVRQSFEPTTLQEAMEFSKIIADSELAPKDFRGKPANIMVALQLAKELNVPPMQALQGIAVVNGRATVWGDLMWALVTNHPAFEDAIEEITDTQAKITLKRRGRSSVIVTFTKADAEKAGLWGKQGPWTQYPKRQMQWRARTFAARDLFPDALKGMISAEEAQDYGETIEGTVVQEQPASPAVAASKPEETIGQVGGSAYYNLYRSNGWTPDDSKTFLSESLQIGPPHNKKDSRDIPTSEWTADGKTGGKAFQWANTKSPLRIEGEKLIEYLGFNGEEAKKFCADHKGNWTVIVAELKAELNRRDAAERGE